MKIFHKIINKNLNTEVIKILGIPIYTKEYSLGYCKRKILGGIYKTKINNNVKKYYLFGIRYKKKALENANLKPKRSIINMFIMECFCNKQNELYLHNPLNIKELLENSKNIIISASENYLNHSHGWLKYIFKGNLYSIDSLPFDNKNADLFVLLGGVGSTPAQVSVVVEAMQVNKPVLILEAAFLRSINTFCEQNEAPEYRYDIGCVLDYLTAYYDATRPSYLELMLNDKNLIITDEQKQRARKCIDKIVQNHLTKYNCQPIFTPNIGREGAKKILVVDQSFGDGSIKKGMASIFTFEQMLDAAINENPEADIIVKTHPDTNTGMKTGYYNDMDLRDKKNVYFYTDPINPISLIQYVDKVYVATTQLGFEALMCGKETHIFGMPFYAGWGYTNDRQTCSRRTNKRTIEEIFYIFYILYSYYIDPVKKNFCEIEEAMDYLISTRDKYFREKELNNTKN